jgi:tetratricopeptide (TPR) repeat protein
MNKFSVLPKTFFAALLAAVCVCGAPALFADDTNAGAAAAPAAGPVPATASNLATQDVLRAYLQIQEQLHATQLAIERSRQDAQDVAGRNAVDVGDRLNLIEKALHEQQSSSRLVLLVTVALAVTGLGFLGVLSASYFQARAMQRFTETALQMKQRELIGGPDPRLLGAGGSAEQATAQLIATIERLEKHIRELEAAKSLPGLAETNGHGAEISPRGEPPVLSENARQIDVLLGKGQSLLSLGQNDAALVCFDEALALDPNHTEALIKRGAACEKMQKLDEAVACYDRAIAADNTVTIAYLYKGGVFNRMERYNEALACYEQALKTQEKAHSRAA